MIEKLTAIHPLLPPVLGVVALLLAAAIAEAIDPTATLTFSVTVPATGFQGALFSLPSLTLVGDEDHRRLALAQPFREFNVQLRDPGTGVDQEQGNIRLRERLIGLGEHPRLQAVTAGVAFLGAGAIFRSHGDVHE